MLHNGENSECQMRVIVKSQLCQALFFALTFNIECQRTHRAVETDWLNSGQVSSMWVCTWACGAAMKICLYDSDNRTLMREDRRGEIRLEEHNRKEKGREKAEPRETSFVFLICFMLLLLCWQLLCHGYCCAFFIQVRDTVSKAILDSGVGEVIRAKSCNFTFNRNYHPYENLHL